jgi:hypothetical protein
MWKVKTERHAPSFSQKTEAKLDLSIKNFIFRERRSEEEKREKGQT